MIDVDRERVMAYRIAVQGLADRSGDRPADLPVLDLGVQEYTPDSTRVALAARPDSGRSGDPGRQPGGRPADRDLPAVPRPGRERQKEVWRILGNPGALLVYGEVAGVWRARMAGRKRVDLTVTTFGRLTTEQVTRVEEEAAQVARARGVAEARVIHE